jgi:hypothetical protein
VIQLDKLWVVFGHEFRGDVFIKKVEIVGETQNHYKIKCAGIYKDAIKKDDLDKYAHGYAFSFDRARAIVLFNKQLLAKIENSENYIKLLNKMIIKDQGESAESK